MSALDRLKAYSAGRELVELLDNDVRPRDVADRVAALAAAVAEEARSAAAAAAAASAPAANGSAAAAAADAAAAATQAFASARAVLEGVSMTSPWGKHDIGFGADALLLRGGQRVVAVPYSAIQHVAILEQIPKEPKDKNCVVLALRRDSDVRAGKARLDVIVATTKAAPAVSVAVPPGCEHLSEGGKLSGPAAVVLCQLLGAHLPDIQEDTFTSSDPSVFRAPNGHLAAAANARTASGWLFPLPAALLFLGKPSHFVRHSEITGIEFARVGAASSTFDMTVHLAGSGGASGGGGAARVEFGQIDQADLPRLQAYVAECKLPVGPPSSSTAPRQATGGAAKRSAEAAAAAAEAAAAAAAYGGGHNGGGGSDDDDDSDEGDSDFDPEAAERGARPAKRARGGGGGAEGVADQGDSSGGGSEQDDDDDDDDDEDEYEDSDDVSLVDSDALSGDDDSGGGPRHGDDDDDD